MSSRRLDFHTKKKLLSIINFLVTVLVSPDTSKTKQMRYPRIEVQDGLTTVISNKIKLLHEIFQFQGSGMFQLYIPIVLYEKFQFRWWRGFRSSHPKSRKFSMRNFKSENSIGEVIKFSYRKLL